MSTFSQPIAILFVAVALSACASSTQPALSRQDAQISIEADCHPLADSDQPQYIVGYGSLMQDESRKRTSPQAGPAHPVEVAGFRRGWFARGDTVGFSTTYLGVSPDPKGTVNAVIYRVEKSELTATDQREASYCRQNVAMSDIRALEKGPFEMTGGQAWIYINRPEAIATPSARYPIVQSYVDIFVSGCLEQEQRFELKGFARQCLATTRNWSEHWVNDRLYPRRPFIFQPRSRQIDSLLSQQLPEYFSSIRIESR
jgi:gamma-glutamylcyclotransferase (GGCT)/AIG2-like uncharacterized protein YtfP